MKATITAITIALTMALSSCGGAGALGAGLCQAAAAIPDEAIALTTGATALATGGATAAAGEYVKTRPISRLCHEADEVIDLLPTEQADEDGADTTSCGACQGVPSSHASAAHASPSQSHLTGMGEAQPDGAGNPAPPR